jgi:hypothetical protein
MNQKQQSGTHINHTMNLLQNTIQRLRKKQPIRASTGAKAAHVHLSKTTEMLEKGITALVLEADKIDSKTTELSSPNNVGHTGRTIGNVNWHSETLLAEDGFQIALSGETIQHSQICSESSLECR